MAGFFQPYEPHQQFLLPPSLQDWLQEDHVAYFISDTVDQLDISSIVKKYRGGGSGNTAYHPSMMLKLLILAYCSGVFSSRRIARDVHENIAFRVLAAGHFPSHRTICRFRKDHIDEFQALFVQVVQIAVETGLVKMGQLSIDGTKIKASASKRRAMSYGHIQEEEKKLKVQIKALTKAAINADELEDEEFGERFDGNNLPDELARREKRLKTIQDGKKQIEKRKRDEAARQEAELKARGNKPNPRNKGKQDKKTGKPEDKDQVSFTDPDSRIMKSGSGFEQAFNAQIAVDDEEQLIIAAEVTQDPTDVHQLLPVLDTAIRNTGTKPNSLLADAGYMSEQNLEGLDDREIDGFIAVGRKAKNRKISDDCPATQRMQRKLKTKQGVKEYGKRKHKVEAPIGWIKMCLGFRSFSMKGVENVRGEFALVCLAMNLKRLTTRMVWS